jgi:hypothetical protein
MMLCEAVGTGTSAIFGGFQVIDLDQKFLLSFLGVHCRQERLEPIDDGGGLGALGDVGKLIGVSLMIVQLNFAIRHANVAIALVADRVIVPPPSGDRGTGARSSRITKLWDEALAFQLFVLRDTAQLVERRKDIEEADRLAAPPARLVDARRDDDQRHS